MLSRIPAAARLLKLRGQAMQKAVPAGIGAMAALLGADMDLAREICAEAAPVPRTTGRTGRTEVVQPANDNGGGQVVISGHRAAIERAIEIAKAKGVKRAMLLPVSAPFHCALMAPAADAMAEALEKTPPTAPCVPLVANVSAKRESDPGRIRDLLVQQVTATVRWRECVEAMTDDGGRQFHRTRRRQGIDGTDQAHRAGRVRHRCRNSGGDRGGAEEALNRRPRCSDWTARPRWSPAPRVASARRSPGHCTARRPVALSGTRRDALEALAIQLGEHAHVCPADLRDRVGTRSD